MMNNKPFTKLFKAYNSLNGLYYRRGWGFNTVGTSDATLLNEAEVAVLKYTYLNVKTELFGIKMLAA
jgi:uncharacterized protein YdcH (DUF465 family)